MWEDCSLRTALSKKLETLSEKKKNKNKRSWGQDANGRAPA
jgi:hypothetical protein